MNLRSGAYYRSGNPSVADTQSKVLTQESTARTLSQTTQHIEDLESDHLSESSMDTNSSLPSQGKGVELDYNIRLKYHLENTHGAKIYKDFLNRYAVKIEDHASAFDPSPWVNYQEDRYMGKDAVMYLIVDKPEDVDTLGNIMPGQPAQVDEGPPTTIIQGFKLVNSITTHRVLIDDVTKALYKRTDSGTEFFYIRNYPEEHILTEEKILYVYINTGALNETSLLFIDKFCMEWDLMLEEDLRGVSFLGAPVAKPVQPGTSYNSNNFTTPQPIPRPTPSAPPYPVPGPTPMSKHVWYEDESMPGLGLPGSRIPRTKFPFT